MFNLKNRLWDAFLKLVLFSAGLHVVLLVVYSILHLNFLPLNYFNILDIDLFFPGIINGALSNILSVICIVAIYLLIYFNLTDKSVEKVRRKD